MCRSPRIQICPLRASRRFVHSSSGKPSVARIRVVFPLPCGTSRSRIRTKARRQDRTTRSECCRPPDAAAVQTQWSSLVLRRTNGAVLDHRDHFVRLVRRKDRAAARQELVSGFRWAGSPQSGRSSVRKRGSSSVATHSVPSGLTNKRLDHAVRQPLRRTETLGTGFRRSGRVRSACPPKGSRSCPARGSECSGCPVPGCIRGNCSVVRSSKVRKAKSRVRRANRQPERIPAVGVIYAINFPLAAMLPDGRRTGFKLLADFCGMRLGLGTGPQRKVTRLNYWWIHYRGYPRPRNDTKVESHAQSVQQVVEN